MRQFALVSLALSMGVLPLAAQFEGTIVMTVSNSGAKNPPSNMTWYIKNSRMAMSMIMPANTPMAGGEFRMVVDPVAHTSTMLVPITPEMASKMGGMGMGAKGIKMVMHTDSMAATAKADESTITKLGTSETIAGMKCDDYQTVDKSEKPTRMCITSELGTFVFPPSGGMMGRRSAPPAWTQAFGDRPAFPLKVWTDDGTVQVQVTSVTRGTVPAGVFDVPDGYMDMSAMMGGMRGGH